MKINCETKDITVGVVGLGLMGTSFIATLLMAGHKVIAIAPLPEDMIVAPERIYNHLVQCEKSGLLNSPLTNYLSQLSITEDYFLLASCQLVVECVIEKSEIKRLVYGKIEKAVSKSTVIATNTSAIPISELQKYLMKPDRFLGIHWAEPSYFTRFLEITNGVRTNGFYSSWVYELSYEWGKEPTLLKKDIRGFVTNRLMYAVYREGLSLVTKGQATLEDVDKSFRYDVGSWITLMGIFRRMDFLGLEDFAIVFEALFPTLSTDHEVPQIMQRMVDINAKGIKNLSGLYNYTPEESLQWEEAFAAFNEEIFKLAASYPGEKNSKGEQKRG